MLEHYLNKVNAENVPGNFLEFGIALGGSTIIITKKLTKSRQYHGYDVFSMIPPPTQNDDNDAHERYSVITSQKAE